MKTTLFSALLCMIVVLYSLNGVAQDKLQPYYKVASLKTSMEEATSMVHKALGENGFEIIGEYNPEGSKTLKSIAYTNKDLQSICLKVEDRGILASILKVSLKQNEDKVDVSMLNPMYLFYAYLRDDTETHLKGLETIAGEAKSAMQAIGSDFSGFGGEEKIDDLKKYHYMAFMPYFDDPVELNTFSSFGAGLETIRKNLNSKKGGTLKVYELVLENEKIAIFGVGILDTEDGEAKFIPIIGEENIAAMPYEIVLMDSKATILHGKYRIALHWPELSMGQFMKISSTPGDIEDFLKALTEN